MFFFCVFFFGGGVAPQKSEQSQENHTIKENQLLGNTGRKLHQRKTSQTPNVKKHLPNSNSQGMLVSNWDPRKPANSNC